jgi:hypothetical protein
MRIANNSNEFLRISEGGSIPKWAATNAPKGLPGLGGPFRVFSLPFPFRYPSVPSAALVWKHRVPWPMQPGCWMPICLRTGIWITFETRSLNRNPHGNSLTRTVITSALTSTSWRVLSEWFQVSRNECHVSFRYPSVALPLSFRYAGKLNVGKFNASPL